MSAVVTLIYAVLYRPWGWRLTVPIAYSGDGNFYAMLAKTMQQTGGYETTSLLGAPHGQYLFDFPLGGDHLHWLALRILVFAIHDPYMVVNAYFFIGFILVALSAHFVARALGLRPLTAGVIGVLYAFLPYHFWHSAAHLPLSAYYAAPIGILLVIWSLDDGIPILRSSALAMSPQSRRRRLLLIVVLLVIVGSASSYYAVFVVLLLAGAAVMGGLRSGSWRSLAPAVLLIAAIGVVQLINLAPELLYRAHNGADLQVGVRGAAESEFYGLHVTRLIVPPPSYRLSPLAKLGRRSVNVGYVGEDDSYLGVFGAIGFVLTGALVLAGALHGKTDWWVPRLVRQLGVVIFLAILVATVGGFGFLIAILGFTQIRAWARMTVLIGFASLVALGVVVEYWVLPRLTNHAGGRIAVGCVAALVVAIGVVDQVPVGLRGQQAATRVEERSDRAFVSEMERALPRGAMVFELPAMSFPENGPIVNLQDYDLLKGYLLGTGRLRWSYGGLRGRIADWQQAWSGQPMPKMVEGLGAAGFSALYIDRAGFADSGASVDTALESLIGPPAFQSQDGRLEWYDLRAEQQQLRSRVGSNQLAEVGNLVTDPTEARFSNGIYAVEQSGADSYHWMSVSGAITLVDGGGASRQVMLHLTPSGPTGSHLTIRGSGVDSTIVLQTAGAPVDLPLTLRSGSITLHLTTDAPRVPAPNDQRDLRVKLTGVTVTDPLVSQLLPG